ncbi:N-acetylmuramoyl-L-alanine amidase [Enterococcus asini]|uniref:N-acetylmuramoyl-L-alanine amidase n=1 Tax=Enterococcus asini TaxID=57732 RepID=UPI00288DEDD3|nr:N-acetylmuramoyl-L-alanine amidase [Enterococcus asini]MDT2756986.1 N-acetylmuramoyl-L-alanine amidase [Enterococcus asini]
MATHLFVCGHGQSDPGAGGNGITERDWTRNPLIIAIKKYGAQLKSNKLEFYDTAKDMYQQTCDGWGAYSVSTATASVTELHLDASSNTSTSGGHVIISSQFNADKNDLAIANVVKNYVGWHPAYRSNGISLRSDLLNLNVFAKRGIGYRLVELGFITSKKDTDTLKAKYDAVAKSIVEAVTGETLGASAPKPSQPTISQGIAKPGKGLFYRVHIPNQGWLGYVGSTVTAGTTGKAIPIQAVEVLWDGIGDLITSKAHVEGLGWQPWNYNITGTTGKNKSLEAVQFWLGEYLTKQGYSIEYRTHVSKLGWQPWVRDGAVSGTTGKKLAIEAIEFRMYKNGKLEVGKFV